MILASADWHLTDNPRDQYRHDFQNQLREIIKREQPNALLMAGDIVDAKDRHPARLVNQVVDHIYQLSLLVPVYMISGNHDLTDPDWPFWKFLRRLSNVHYISVPTKIKLPGLKSKCLLLPHTHDYRKDWEEGVIEGYSYVFAHNTFIGADMGNRIATSGIPLDVFGPEQRVLSGDVHIPQTIGDNFQYIGAPYRINYGDTYTPRVLLVEDQKITPIKVKGPLKHVIDVVGDNYKIPKLTAGDMVKIRISISPDETAEWPQLKKQWQEWCDKKQLIVHKIEPLLDHPTMKNIKTREHSSDEQLIERLVKSQKADKITLSIGLKISKGVKCPASNFKN